MPRIHGPPQPHRPISSLEVGMGRGPNYPLDSIARPTTPTPTPTPHLCPLPNVRHNPGLRTAGIDLLCKGVGGGVPLRGDFMSLWVVTTESQERTELWAQDVCSRNIVSHGLSPSCMDLDPAAAPCGFGSSDARDLATRPDISSTQDGMMGQTHLCLAPLCCTAEEACFGFELMSPNTTSQRTQKYGQKLKTAAVNENDKNAVNGGLAGMKNSILCNTVDDAMQGEEDGEISDINFLDTDDFNNAIHVRSGQGDAQF